MKKARHRERGATMVETAIVLTTLLALMFGIVDFGRALYTYNFVGTLAREGARWAIVRGSKCSKIDHCNAQSSDVQTYLQSLNEGALTSSNITATLTPGGCTGLATGSTTNAPGCVAVVTVTYPFKFMMGFMPKGAGATINMTSTSKMVISQ